MGCPCNGKYHLKHPGRWVVFAMGNLVRSSTRFSQNWWRVIFQRPAGNLLWKWWWWWWWKTYQMPQLIISYHAGQLTGSQWRFPSCARPTLSRFPSSEVSSHTSWYCCPPLLSYHGVNLKDAFNCCVRWSTTKRSGRNGKTSSTPTPPFQEMFMPATWSYPPSTQWGETLDVK